LEGTIEKKEIWIEELQEDLVNLKSQIREKEEAMQSLSNTIFEKGEQNRRLSEVVNTFKNQLISDKIFE